MLMRILIDTNILIKLEDNHIIDDNFSSFYNYAKANSCNVYIHPNSRKDLRNDSDSDRKNISLSKLSKYEELPNPAKSDLTFSNLVGEKNSNDAIDNSLLIQIYKGYVELLVTEDKGLIKKAAKLSIGFKVLNVNNALRLLKQKFSIVIPNHPELRHLSIRDLIAFREDTFFDSLKDDYKGFDNWLDKCAKANRHAYVLFIENKLSALLIYNIESSTNHRLFNVYNDAVKMCTFKVGDNALGHKMGELFLSKMVELCINQKITSLYLTVFEKHKPLISLLLSYGFTEHQKNQDGELIMLKNLEKPLNLVDNSNTNYPFYTDSNVNKFIVPIKDAFYSKLFKDGGLRQWSLFDESVNSFKEIEGKTIEKAYICKSKTKNLNPGDILFFYSSRKYKSIEPVGILESIKYSKDSDEIFNLVSKKTVYKEEDIKKMIGEGETVTILIFRLMNYLQKPIKFTDISEFVSVKNKIVTITKLRESEYLILKQNNRFDERYIVN